MKSPRKKRAAKIDRQAARAPTIHDVARLAGVSSMTASRAVSGSARVRDELRNRVMRAVKTLNYVPNVAARAARSGSIRIGIILTNPKSSLLGEFLMGAFGESSQSGVQLVLEPTAAHPEKFDAIYKLIRAGIDGVILPPPVCDSRAAHALLKKAGIEALTFATAEPHAALPAVLIDDFEGAALMTQHLIDLGHRRIAFVRGDRQHSPAQRREAGFRATMEKNALPVRAAWMAQGMFTFKSGLEAARKLLSGAPRPTAIFASNDDMAAGVIAVAQGIGLSLPAELSVAGFDDTPLASTLWPQLTTIHQPISTMASTAVATITEVVRRRRAGAAHPVLHHRMECTLVRRASTAPPSA